MQYTFSVRCDMMNIRNCVTNVYGINVSLNDEIVKSSINLFDRKEDAEEFADICNKLDWDIIHFNDVILDLIKCREPALLWTKEFEYLIKLFRN